MEVMPTVQHLTLQGCNTPVDHGILRAKFQLPPLSVGVQDCWWQSLHTLVLDGCGVEDATIKIIAERVPLTCIVLDDCSSLTNHVGKHLGKILTLTQVGLLNHGKLTKKCIANMKTCTNLTALDLSGCGHMGARIAHGMPVKNFLRLKSLRVASPQHDLDPETLWDTGALERVFWRRPRTNFYPVLGLPGQTPNLRVLCLAETPFSSIGGSLGDLSACVQLEELDLSRCTGIRGLANLAPLRRLHTLRLADCILERENVIHTVILFPALRILDLSAGCTVDYLQDIHLSELYQCTALERLCLDSQRSLTDQVAAYLAICPALRHVQLNNCLHISYDVVALFGATGTLRHLDINHWRSSYSGDTKHQSVALYPSEFPHLLVHHTRPKSDCWEPCHCERDVLFWENMY